ncbi:ABI five binding protein 3 [Actinidia rufa]|uniref:Ninja-family protein n=1 Tax=Actinidia rufa TaxID=165716 RepID=A0A7J0H1Y2_9ERIC|nr:ABI five binding protein 3 [Actinidia rufa]
MGEANRDGVAEILLSIRRNPAKFAPKFSEFSDSEHLDLNLGLSLGGLYSQIPKEKPLIRTSSLNIDLALGENEGGGGGFLSLTRSASLPTEAEQEMRKIREIQAMKRMEVKRRLLEKQRNNRGGCSDQEGKLSNLPFEKLKFNACSSTNRGIQGPENSTAAKVSTLSQPTLVTSKVTENGKSVDTTNFRSAPLFMLEKSENGKQVSPPNGKPVEPAETEHERPSKKVKVLGNDPTTSMEMWKQMPSVTTIGDGPNGKRIEGLLYRYSKGQVSIVCICHGNFLSPAEFVKHAGGTDVANPMKHINVLAKTI